MNILATMMPFLAKKKLSIKSFLQDVLSAEDLSRYETLYNGDRLPVNFDKLVKMLGIRKDNGLRILRDLYPDENELHWSCTKIKAGRGRPREVFMLSNNASQVFCMNSQTPRGRELTKFFANLVEMLLQYDALTREIERRSYKQEALVQTNANYPLVYLADVFYVRDGTLNVLKKIGWTADIKSRLETLTSDMKALCVFTHIFPCVRGRALEQDVLKEPVVLRHLFSEPINGHTSTETLQFSDDFTEADLVALISGRVDVHNERIEERTNTLSHDMQKVALEQRQLEVLETFVAAGLGKMRAGEMMNGSQLISGICIPAAPAALFEAKPRKNIKGYKIQRINPNDLSKPMAVFESAIEVSRRVPGSSKTRIKNAIAYNTLYMDSRWMKVAHGEDENVIHNLPPLQTMRRVTKGLVVKMDQNRVIKLVFRTQREAMHEAQLNTTGAISNAIKNGTRSHGHYYDYWLNCTEDQRHAYISDHGYPEAPENRGIRVNRLDTSGRIVETYNNMEAIVKSFQVCRKVLKEGIEKRSLVRGFLWEYA